MSGRGNPVHVERAHGLADLADQELRRPELGVVALAPEKADPARTATELGEIAEECAAPAHLAAHATVVDKVLVGTNLAQGSKEKGAASPQPLV